MPGDLRIEGAAQFTSLARDLKAAGDSGKGLRLALLKELRVIAAPIKADVQRNAFNIPAKGPRSTGLRLALMRAVRTTVSMAARTASLRVIVDPSKMPSGGEGKWVAGSGQQALPSLMEGNEAWRKPLFGDKDHWYPQAPHPFIGPAADAHQEDATIAAAAAVAQTIALLEKGNREMVLGRDQILNAEDVTTKEVHVPEWADPHTGDDVVLVRGLTGTERDDYEASLRVLRNKEFIPNLNNMKAKLVGRAIINADGTRVFTDKDIALLGQKSAQAIQRIFKVVSEMSGLSNDAEEDALADLGDDPSDDSSST